MVNLDFDWFWLKWPFCPFELIDPLPFKIDDQDFKHMVFQIYRGHVQSSTSKFSRNLDKIPNPSFVYHLRRLMSHLQNFKSSDDFGQFLVQRLSKCQWDVVASILRVVHWSIALLSQNPDLTGESKEWFFLQSITYFNPLMIQTDGQNILRYAINFELERSRGLDDKVLLEQLVNAINLQSLRKTW